LPRRCITARNFRRCKGVEKQPTKGIRLRAAPCADKTRTRKRAGKGEAKSKTFVTRLPFPSRDSHKESHNTRRGEGKRGERGASHWEQREAASSKNQVCRSGLLQQRRLTADRITSNWGVLRTRKRAYMSVGGSTLLEERVAAAGNSFMRRGARNVQPDRRRRQPAG